MTFSERYGYVKPRDVIQLESMDDKLRTGLWNLLSLYIFEQFSEYYINEYSNGELNKFTLRLWVSFYHRAFDDRPVSRPAIVTEIKRGFFDCPWYSIYDFVEFVVAEYEFYDKKEEFVRDCNLVLEYNVSAYRIVDDKVVRITEESEISEIESALDKAAGPEGQHIQRALELLSDRVNPDYRNSIKESISAVESLVQTALGEKGTLGQLLKKLEEKTGLHGSLKGAFSSLYGYASDEGGIRHAMLDEVNIKFEDAKFMLVACSAFINLVKMKLNA